MFQYKIAVIHTDSSEIIAKFVNDHDRDTCLDALREEYPDVVLRAKDDE